MKIRKALALLLVFAVLFSLCACSSAPQPAAAEAPKEAETYELTFSIQGGQDLPMCQRWRDWAETVTAETDGRVTFQFYYDSTLLDPDSAMQQLKAGVASIGDVHKYANDGFVMMEKWKGMTAGCPIEGVSTMGRQLVEAIPELAAEMDGIKPLAYAFDGGNYQLLTVDKPVHTVEDVKNMVIWCEADFNAFVEEMGATPVNTPWAEVYSSLQKSMYDGLLIAAETLKVANFADVCKYATMINIAYLAAPGHFMNIDLYNSMPDDIKAVIDDPALAKTIEEKNITQALASDEEAIDWAVETKGTEIIEISEEEHQKFVDCVNRAKDGMVKSFNEKGLPGDEFLSKFVELSAEY